MFAFIELFKLRRRAKKYGLRIIDGGKKYGYFIYDEKDPSNLLPHYHAGIITIKDVKKFLDFLDEKHA